jgi:hypothetical protein
MMMTAFETTYCCGIWDLKLKSFGVAKPLKKLAIHCLPKKFIKNLINEVDYTTELRKKVRTQAMSIKQTNKA